MPAKIEKERIIVLDEEFNIFGTNYDWRLERVRPENKSNDQWFFPKLNQALKRYVNESTKSCSNVEELYNKLEELNNKIDSIKL